MRKITKLDLIKVMWRSFYVQAVWNFERLQNLGFLFSISPVLRKLYPEKEKRVDALNRHLEFFCTHPYLASILMGVVVSMEERLANNNGVKPEDVRSIKSIMSGPLAAIGDSLFWATLRPFSALIGVVIVFSSSGLWQLAGPAFFLIFYNTFHLYIRFMGVIKGYKLNTAVVDMIRRFDYQGIIALVNLLGLLVLGVMLIVYTSGFGWLKNVVFYATFVLAIIAMKRKVYTGILIYAVVVLSIVFSYLGLHF